MDKVTKKDSIIGRRIRRFRRRAELTQEQLSEKVNVSTTHIGLVETGYRRMSLKTLQKVARVLKIRVKDLIPY